MHRLPASFLRLVGRLLTSFLGLAGSLPCGSCRIVGTGHALGAALLGGAGWEGVTHALRDLEVGAATLGTLHQQPSQESLYDDFRDFNEYHTRVEIVPFRGGRWGGGGCVSGIAEGHFRPSGSGERGVHTRDICYRITSISGTTFSGKKCLSGTIFHAI
jgi:hypothetical protein